MQIITAELGKYRNFKPEYTNYGRKGKTFGDKCILTLQYIYNALYNKKRERIEIDNVEQLKKILVETHETIFSVHFYELYKYCKREYLAINRFCTIINNLYKHFEEKKKSNDSLSDDDFWHDIHISLRPIGHCRLVDWISTRIEYSYYYFQTHSLNNKIEEMKKYIHLSNSNNSIPVFLDNKNLTLSKAIESHLTTKWCQEKEFWSKYIHSYNSMTNYCIRRFFELGEFKNPVWRPKNYTDPKNVYARHLSNAAKGIIFVLLSLLKCKYK